MGILYQSAWIEAQSHLINLHGNWNVGPDGRLPFQTQAQADRYNGLVEAYNESWMIFSQSFDAITQLPR